MSRMSQSFCFFLLLLIYFVFVIDKANSFVVFPTSRTTNINKHYQQQQHSTQQKRNEIKLQMKKDDPDRPYDLAVIGGGPVGFQAALAAANFPYHKKVCLIDAPRASGALMNEATGEDLSIGGPTGLFSKALRDTSKRIRVSTLRGMGLREDSIWNEIITSCLELASQNAQDVFRQLQFAGVDYIEGSASFPDGGTTNSLFVSQQDFATGAASVQTVQADKILITTGSTPFRPGGIPFDGKRIFDSDSINKLSFLPKSIAITGSGIIAIEYARIFRNLGVDVTLIIRDKVPRNALRKIGLDTDVAATLVADLVRSGIRIERGAQVKSFQVDDRRDSNAITLTLEGRNGAPLATGQEEQVKCDIYLAAVGRKPNSANLNLQCCGIDVDEYGGIKVDSKLCTTAKAGNVFAAGDVLGRPFLASTGVAQGFAAVTAMFEQEVPDTKRIIECNPEEEVCVDGDISLAGESFDPGSLAANPFAFPTGIWSSPEAAYYGLSVDQAKELGVNNVGEAIALYAECLRGRVFSPNGLLKLVFEKTSGRILGVHICGDDACELIHYGMELVKAKRTISDLTSSLYSAVTFHEMYRIAAQAALDESGARKRRFAASSAVAARNRKRKK